MLLKSICPKIARLSGTNLRGLYYKKITENLWPGTYQIFQTRVRGRIYEVMFYLFFFSQALTFLLETPNMRS